jgi:DMSO/TMAO reductase YedYZ molybdopterin-dependent catalytic subunit
MTTVALVALVGASATSRCAGPVARHATPLPLGTSQPATPPPIPTAAARLATAPSVTALGNVEVRSYKGTRLDAVSSEPENSIKGPQRVDVKTYRLEVTGLVTKPLSLTYADVTAMPAYRKATTLDCVDGWSVTYLWQGVLIKDLLARAGFDATARIVIFRCADGYSESLPLDFVLDRDILLAYRMNGVVMPPERGFPFQVVAEDRLGYKWAKWVTGIEVSDNTRFAGYWESRGADNTATLSGTD